MANLRQQQTFFWRIITDIIICFVKPVAFLFGVLVAIKDLWDREYI